MAQFVFGSGAIYATPLVDAAGNAVTNPTPVKFLACQDISVDMTFDTKMLHGGQQFALAVARGKGKASVKAKNGQVNGTLLNNAFFGQTLSTGQESYVQDITGAAIPATTPFFINPTPPNSGVWAADMGVRNASGVPMTRVATSPATGQYSVHGPVTGAAQASFATNVMTVTVAGTGSFAVGQVITSATVAAGTYITALGTGTGGIGTYTLSTTPGTIAAQSVSATEVYEFAAADAGLTTYIDYRYTVTTGRKIAIANQLLGSTPTVALDIVVPYQGKQLTCRFPNAIAGKFAMATKLDDFTIPEVDFDCFADATGAIGTISLAE